ncbi:ABC transporter permease [Lactobacillus sp. M0398]|uniref:ABC transporter permease n=1 Tax=unclassified Lactobacillus TaxID=2620435 RepID=UPI0018DD5204|nr:MULTISPECIES: ABC transporter permease [unclassified Lactobacillus]MBI0120569.1 ABC transporter permease [Lactobacillus sp. M0398]MBI0122963.1 ABC transporter permease [Lactobacillus sp. W8174]MBI0134886.1 ABC transporter permease [Lactobacillus sp. W8173]
MFALFRRNLKIYFSNIPAVFMSCLGALISFFIYIGFLQNNLRSNWQQLPNVTKMLDLWMIAGIVAVSGITTAFQALGQQVSDRETRADADFELTGISRFAENFAYILSGTTVSFFMQIITFIVMAMYFSLVDHISIPQSALLPGLLYILVGAIAATLLDEIIVLFMHSSTTFSRLSAVLGAAAGFAVATYLPYGILVSGAQSLVKLVPSSYEAAALRYFLLKQTLATFPANVKRHLTNYLGIQFKMNNWRLNNMLVLLLMIAILILVIGLLSFITDRRSNK